MILTEQHINERILKQHVGNPIEFKLSSLKVKGSPGMFLKSFLSKAGDIDSFSINSKCNIEKRTNGIVIYSNYLNKVRAIPIPKNEILEMTIKRGKEIIDPFFLSPLWILLKLNVSILYARYFRLRLHEYSIEQMELEILTSKYDLKFIANGYLFEKQYSFLESLEQSDKLRVLIKK